uniref:NADP-dependent oxidoreductase domain-containing protein n=1 Tax=Timema shepardi TaxID=629360 RepID=A0A7R9G2Q2_TIMSH|nr:unnamed protein product [Timema shepardi]
MIPSVLLSSGFTMPTIGIGVRETHNWGRHVQLLYAHFHAACCVKKRYSITTPDSLAYLVELSESINENLLGLQVTPSEVSRVVQDAIDVGYRHLDCAPLYNNEREVGDAIRARIQEGSVLREELFVSTKVRCGVPPFREDKQGDQDMWLFLMTTHK